MHTSWQKWFYWRIILFYNVSSRYWVWSTIYNAKIYKYYMGGAAKSNIFFEGVATSWAGSIFHFIMLSVCKLSLPSYTWIISCLLFLSRLFFWGVWFLECDNCYFRKKSKHNKNNVFFLKEKGPFVIML